MYREIFKTYYTTLFIFRLKTSDVSAKNEKSSRREINMGKIVFESVDTFITRNVSSFRNRDYYREMEKEITKDVESLRERRTERARRRKLHFHRGHLPPLTPLSRICISRSSTKLFLRNDTRSEYTYREHIENFSPCQILKNPIFFFFFPSNLPIRIETRGYVASTNFDESENIFRHEEFVVKVVDLRKGFLLDRVFFLHLHEVETCLYNGNHRNPNVTTEEYEVYVYRRRLKKPILSFVRGIFTYIYIAGESFLSIFQGYIGKSSISAPLSKH